MLPMVLPNSREMNKLELWVVYERSILPLLAQLGLNVVSNFVCLALVLWIAKLPLGDSAL